MINVAAELQPVVAQIKLADKADLPPLLVELHLDTAERIWADLETRISA